MPDTILCSLTSEISCFENPEGGRSFFDIKLYWGYGSTAESVFFERSFDPNAAGDKAKYAVELVWRGDKLFAGHVTRTWKGLDPKTNKSVNKTAFGTVEVK